MYIRAITCAALIAACSAFAVPLQSGEQALVQDDARVDLCAAIKTVVASLADGEYFDEKMVHEATQGGEIKLDALQTVLRTAVKQCTPCGDGHYTSTACTNVTNSACSACTTAGVGEYVVHDCKAGSLRVVGSNTEVSKCTEPTGYQYVTDACTTRSDTRFAYCPNATSGQSFVAKVCEAGSHDKPGNAGQVKTCAALVEGKYRVHECIAGKAFEAGADAEFADCTNPSGDQYVSHTCTTTANTKTSDCAKPSTGQYVSKACVAGSHNESGSNSEVKDCTVAVPGKFLSQECKPGSPFTAGSDATFTNCAEPKEHEYVSSICSDAADTKTSECPLPGTDSYVFKACVAGSHSQAGIVGVVKKCTESVDGKYRSEECKSGSAYSAGSDAEFTTCSAPSGKQYVIEACTKTSNTKLGNCPEPKTNEYVSKACVAGSIYEVGAIGEVKACTSSTQGHYRSKECKSGSVFEAGADSEFTKCSEPTGARYVKAICGETTDTQFGEADVPQAGQYVSKVAVAGSSSKAGSNTEFSSCTVKKEGHYQSKECAAGSPFSAGSDAEFTGCSEPSGDKYVKTSCGETTDTEFGDCPSPDAKNYVSKACVAGTHSAPGSSGELSSCTESVHGKYRSQACKPGTPFHVGENAVFTDCTKPTDNHYVSQVCSDLSDTKFSECPSPTSGQYVSKACVAGAPDQLGSIGEVALCTGAQKGKYRAQACNQGSPFSAGSDAEYKDCSEPTGDHYVTATCSETKDTEFGVCQSPGANEYVSKACVAGSHSSAGHINENTMCTGISDGKYRTKACSAGDTFHAGHDAEYASCSEPSGTQYVTAACTEEANTQLATCSVALDGHYVTAACERGSKSQVGTDTKTAECTKCTQFQAETKACTKEANTVCTDLCGFVGSTAVSTQVSTITTSACKEPVLIGQFTNSTDDLGTVRVVRTDKHFDVELVKNCEKAVDVTGTETLDYLILEAGEHDDYTAGTAQITKTLTDVKWSKDYGNYPLIFTTSLSRSNKYFGIIRTSATGDAKSTQLKIQTDELTGAANAATETVGYLVFKSGCSSEPSKGSNGERCGLARTEGASKLLRTGNIQVAAATLKYELALFYSTKGEDVPNTYHFTTKFSAPPVVLSQMLTINGANPSFVRTVAKSATTYQFTADEEMCKDKETWHLSEYVAILAIGS